MTLSTFNHIQLGHMVSYQKTTLECPMGDGLFYYTDKRMNFEHGPFASVFDAINDWHEAYSVMPKKPPFPAPSAVEQPLPDNVIYVDFVNKVKKAK